ncbi:MAG: hypothetical protein ACR2PJ_05065, partial [Pseudomonadales bacterium]
LKVGMMKQVLKLILIKGFVAGHSWPSWSGPLLKGRLAYHSHGAWLIAWLLVWLYVRVSAKL